VLPALIDGDALASPTVGTFRAALPEGAPLRPGDRLGALLRAGRWVDLIVPDGVGGVAHALLADGSWVQCGEALCHVAAAEAVVGAAPRRAAAPSDVPDGLLAIRAETDGTAYLRPEPGAPPFAAVGEAVAAGQTVALVEVMKTFTPVRAPRAGVVERVLVGEAAPVRAGAALLWVRPA
jgi:biotin carboxyl carrier protein